MNELRHDPVQRRWVIIATARSKRPTDFPRRPSSVTESGPCPFCPGHEAQTPPEIFSVPREDGSGWSVRVVPNKFPALTGDEDPELREIGIYQQMNGTGAHEVIIETPEHALDLDMMPQEQLTVVLSTYRERLSHLLSSRQHKYALIFRNHGEAAGASLAHPHTQLIATPITPLQVAAELESSRVHFEKTARCLFCDIIEQELREGARLLSADEHFVAYMPFASRFPYEVHIAPRAHSHSFVNSSPALLKHLAGTLGHALARLRVSLDDPPYNFVLHTAPNIDAVPRRPGYWKTLEQDYHWHIEILPRLTPIAGFEWGTGLHINPTAPEDAIRLVKGD